MSNTSPTTTMVAESKDCQTPTSSSVATAGSEPVGTLEDHTEDLLSEPAIGFWPYGCEPISSYNKKHNKLPNNPAGISLPYCTWVFKMFISNTHFETFSWLVKCIIREGEHAMLLLKSANPSSSTVPGTDIKFGSQEFELWKYYADAVVLLQFLMKDVVENWDRVPKVTALQLDAAIHGMNEALSGPLKGKFSRESSNQCFRLEHYPQFPAITFLQRLLIQENNNVAVRVTPRVVMFILYQWVLWHSRS